MFSFSVSVLLIIYYNNKNNLFHANTLYNEENIEDETSKSLLINILQHSINMY